MRGRSIRFRLTVWYAVALTLGLGLFSSLVWLLLRNRLMSELDQELAGRASRFEQYFRGESAEVEDPDQLRDELDEFCQALPPSSYVRLRSSAGFGFNYPDASSPEGSLRMLQRRFRSGGQIFDLDVGAPTTGLAHTLQLLGWLLVSLVPVVIAIACAGGAWLSARALKPIQGITSAASAISIENLSARLPAPETNDEISRLTTVLNDVLARLEAAVKQLSQFAADASHELRTPLAVIRATAELALRRPRAPEAYRESLAEIAAETERMTQLVEDLLMLARRGTDASQMPRSPLELGGLLLDVCAELRGLAATRQIVIEAQLRDRSTVVSGNRAALHRLFVILLDNAIKYSRAGAAVRLGMVRERDSVSVTIQDSGAGISQADLPHIFERHYRAGASEESSQGYGIGLSLAESIAQAHGAGIEVRSTPGAFSEFRVSFPLASTPTPDSANLQIEAIS